MPPSHSAGCVSNVASMTTQDDAAAVRILGELSERVLQDHGAGSLRLLQKRALSLNINGALLRGHAVQPARTEGIAWLTRKFASFGWRDEWLLQAVTLMDRAATVAAAEASDPRGQVPASSSSSRPASSPPETGRSSALAAGAAASAARRLYNSASCWLACVLTTLKLSEADTVMNNPDLRDVAAAFGVGTPDAYFAALPEADAWRSIVVMEFRIHRKLNYRVSVPSVIDLVSRMSLELCAAACNSAVENQWQGFVHLRLPAPVAPTSRRSSGESRSSASKPSASSHTQCVSYLASHLAELAVAYAPEEVYGTATEMAQLETLPPALVSAALLCLACHSFGCPPPEVCVRAIGDMMRRVHAPCASPLPLWKLQHLMQALQQIWISKRDPKACPAARKWQDACMFGSHAATTLRTVDISPDTVAAALDALSGARSSSTVRPNRVEAFRTPQRSRSATKLRRTPGSQATPTPDPVRPTPATNPSRLALVTGKSARQQPAEQFLQEPPAKRPRLGEAQPCAEGCVAPASAAACGSRVQHFFIGDDEEVAEEEDECFASTSSEDFGGRQLAEAAAQAPASPCDSMSAESAFKTAEAVPEAAPRASWPSCQAIWRVEEVSDTCRRRRTLATSAAGTPLARLPTCSSRSQAMIWSQRWRKR
eukprot:TRINITY_DN10015_c0_g1_i2.p1 TRINITY_DN10015_c0_g1~~TRINITY_DN10015_c0_g1_i2.p1  ORF type:complete len:655 (-),score=136.93 TRINITY_DN10015_c0_g1_i2:657-2621(-)